MVTGVYKSTRINGLKYKTPTLPTEIFLKYRGMQHIGLTHILDIPRNLARVYQMTWQDYTTNKHLGFF